jgi:hypothetical protein
VGVFVNGEAWAESETNLVIAIKGRDAFQDDFERSKFF